MNNRALTPGDIDHQAEVAKRAKFLADLIINLPSDLREFITDDGGENQRKFMSFLYIAVDLGFIPKSLAQQFLALYIKHRKGIVKHGR